MRTHGFLEQPRAAGGSGSPPSPPRARSHLVALPDLHTKLRSARAALRFAFRTCDAGWAFLSQVLPIPVDSHSTDLLAQLHLSVLQWISGGMGGTACNALLSLPAAAPRCHGSFQVDQCTTNSFRAVPGNGDGDETGVVGTRTQLNTKA